MVVCAPVTGSTRVILWSPRLTLVSAWLPYPMPPNREGPPRDGAPGKARARPAMEDRREASCRTKSDGAHRGPFLSARAPPACQKFGCPTEYARQHRQKQQAQAAVMVAARKQFNSNSTAIGHMPCRNGRADALRALAAFLEAEPSPP